MFKFRSLFPISYGILQGKLLIVISVDGSKQESVPALDIWQERAAGGYCSPDHLLIPSLKVGSAEFN